MGNQPFIALGRFGRASPRPTAKRPVKRRNVRKSTVVPRSSPPNPSNTPPAPATLLMPIESARTPPISENTDVMTAGKVKMRPISAKDV